MAKAKKDDSEKVKKVPSSAKLSKEMKADIEKMMDKRLSSIEKQLEKLKGSDSKGGNSKSSDSKGNGRKTAGKTKANKGKQDKSTKTKKTGGRGRKKSNQRNEDAE